MEGSKEVCNLGQRAGDRVRRMELWDDEPSRMERGQLPKGLRWYPTEMSEAGGGT